MRSPLISGMVACSLLFLVACSGAHAGESLFGGDGADAGISNISDSTSSDGGALKLPKVADAGKKSPGSSTTSDPDTNQCEGAIGSSSCNKCIERSCCDEAIACASEAQCGGFIQCGAACGPNPQCVEQCAVANPSGVATLQALVGCMSKHCSKQCK